MYVDPKLERRQWTRERLLIIEASSIAHHSSFMNCMDRLSLLLGHLVRLSTLVFEASLVRCRHGTPRARGPRGMYTQLVWHLPIVALMVMFGSELSRHFPVMVEISHAWKEWKLRQPQDEAFMKA